MITTIVPIYHGEKYIKQIIEQIEKAANGTDEKVELIFSNDDPNYQINEKIKSSCIDVIVLNTNTNVGIHNARIRGLKQARGKYILFLDQDDKISPQYFKKQLGYLKNADVVICGCIESLNSIYESRYDLDKVITKEYLLSKGNFIISPGQALIKRNAISDIWCNYIIKNNGADDYFLWICMVSEGKKIVSNKEPLYEHVISNSNQSKNLLDMAMSEMDMLEIVKAQRLLDDKEFEKFQNCIEKHHIYKIAYQQNIKKKYELVIQMIKNEMNGKSVCNLISERKIVIYGAGDIGISLAMECKRNGVEPLGFIDKIINGNVQGIPIHKLGYPYEGVEAIIITLVDGFEEIYKMLKELYDCKVYFLQEIVYRGNI